MTNLFKELKQVFHAPMKYYRTLKLQHYCNIFFPLSPYPYALIPHLTEVS